MQITSWHRHKISTYHLAVMMRDCSHKAVTHIIALDNISVHNMGFQNAENMLRHIFLWQKAILNKIEILSDGS